MIARFQTFNVQTLYHFYAQSENVGKDLKIAQQLSHVQMDFSNVRMILVFKP